MRDTTSEICSESDKDSLIASPSSFISCLSCGSTESPYKAKLSRSRARRESRAPRGIRRELPFRRSGKHYVRGKGPRVARLKPPVRLHRAGQRPSAWSEILPEKCHYVFRWKWVRE